MTNKNVYSPYKITKWMNKLDEIKKGKLPYPVFIQWDLSNVCNMNCTFCFYRIWGLTDWNDKEYMPTETVMRVMDELKGLGVKAIEWTGGGSIECHPDWKKIIKRAKELGFKQALVTNGTLLDDEGLELIKDFEWVRFSVDAADKETFKKIKRIDQFDRVMETIKKFLKIKESNCVLGFSTIVCPENHKQIYETAKLAKDLGCDNARFSLALTPKGNKLFENIWSECLKQLDKLKELNDDNFRIFTFSNRINELSEKVFSRFCGYHHLVGVIAPRGVYPCCRVKDYKKYNFGDLNKQTFKEIWLGEKRKKFIEDISKGCPFSCWMADKNKFIEYLLDDNPPHKEFI